MAVPERSNSDEGRDMADFRAATVAKGFNTDLCGFIRKYLRSGQPHIGAFRVTRKEVEWLLREANLENRDMRTHRTSALTRTMNRGWWVLTHQGIALGLDKNGKLVIIDGQNRLVAFLASTLDELEILVSVGWERAKMVDAVDGVIERTARVRKAMNPQRGDPTTNVTDHDSYTTALYQIVFNGPMPSVAVEEMRERYKFVAPSVQWSVQNFSNLRGTDLSRSVVGGMLALAHHFYPAEMEALGGKIISYMNGGEGFPEGHALRVLVRARGLGKAGKTTGSTDRLVPMKRVLSLLFCALHDIPTTNTAIRKDALDHWAKLIAEDAKLGKLKREAESLLPGVRELIGAYSAPRGGTSKKKAKSIAERAARIASLNVQSPLPLG